MDEWKAHQTDEVKAVCTDRDIELVIVPPGSVVSATIGCETVWTVEVEANFKVESRA